MKTIYTGIESSGKSLMLAMKAIELVERNAKWYERQVKDYEKLGPIAFMEKYKRETPVKRPIAIKAPMSKKFDDFAAELGVIIVYFNHKHELILLRECDVIVDEVASLWNARAWQEMSMEETDWINQAAKSGVEIYGASLDFAMVDKGFRMLTNRLYYVKKTIFASPRPSATKPPVSFIWGLCLYWEMDPKKYDEAKAEFEREQTIPSWFTIQRKFCELYDTNRKIPRSETMPFRHIARRCGDPECTFHKVTHV